MAPRAAFWVDRHISFKFTVFVWESDGKKLSLKMNTEQNINSNVKILGKKSVFTKFKGCGCAEKPSVAFLAFHTFACKFAGKIIDKCMEIKTGLNIF